MSHRKALFSLAAFILMLAPATLWAHDADSNAPAASPRDVAIVVESTASAWCNAISFEKTRVQVSRGKTVKLTVRATCPQSVDPNGVVFPEGVSGVFVVRPDKGLQLTLAVSFQAGEEWNNNNGILRGPEAAIEYAPQGKEAQTIVIIELKGRKPKEVNYKFTD